MTRGDKLVIACTLALAAASYAAVGMLLPRGGAEYAVICVDGSEYARYRLSEISGKRTIEVKTRFGSNTVELTADGARVTEASCRDKYDVKCGAVTKPGQAVICAPNRFSLRITGGGDAVDRVTY